MLYEIRGTVIRRTSILVYACILIRKVDEDAHARVYLISSVTAITACWFNVK